jgi:type IV secretory pathway component VirB8
MDRMDQNGIETKLDALFAEYRSAFPEQDGGVNFMPNLWQKIEARRMENVSVFRRLAQACVLATAALTVAMAILIPRIQTEPVYTATYVDVLDAAHSVDSAQLMDSGELQ